MFIVFNPVNSLQVFAFILIYCSMIVFCFYRPYFHDPNNVLFLESTHIPSFSIDKVLTLSILLETMSFRRRRTVFKLALLVICIYGTLRLLKGNNLNFTLQKDALARVDTNKDVLKGFITKYATKEVKNSAIIKVLNKINQKNITAHLTPIVKHTPLSTVIVKNRSAISAIPTLPAKVSIVKGNPDICRSSKHLKWILYIHSAPTNRERRATVRDTWGNKYLFENRRATIVFLVGIPRQTYERKIIDDEYDRYGDIVQGDFIEDYRNLTYKAILALQFISSYCSHVPYAIKSDDDVFSSIFKIMQLTEEQGPLKRFLMCFRWHGMPIQRPGKKIIHKTWWVPYDVLPDKEEFDPYCAGLGWIFSTNIMKELLTYAYSTPFFWIDDVYISGMVMNQMKNMSIINLMRVVAYETILGDVSPFRHSNYVFSHKHPRVIRRYWNNTLHQLDDDMLRELNISALAPYPELLQRRKELSSTKLA